ncbi:ASKHA domain-containing protein [Porticoccaceae bacterium]|nr:ASKHA domain-containing protein [Porticoccaceae bacterium]MDB4262597.1 ASKHA domain-containing protein [Porticoccaceae bacterium]MDB4308759.1 ASKHA domain-containing protein [Porticoccaceae bacterium]
MAAVEKEARDVLDSTDNRVKVVFTPSGRRGSFPVNTPLLHAARVLGVDIDSVCGGRGLCGRCQIICAEGSFPKHQIDSDSSHLSPVCATEIKYGERKTPLANGRRLSCHTLLLDDVVIDVPPESQVHRQIVRKDAEYRDISLDPATRLYYVQVDDADMHVPKGDLQRLIEALEQQWGLPNLACDSALLRTLQPVLAKGKRGITVAVYNNKDIIALWPGFRDKAYGVAVDVGSTTIAAHLCDLSSGEVMASASLMNPQIRFGEDLMSRVSYVMMHPEGADEMTLVIREALNSLFVEVAVEIGVTVEDILEISLVANPIMHHILLGISPVELGGAPFALTTDAAVELPAVELDLQINGGGRIYILPCIAGHVGADTAGMILSEAPQEQDQMTLLVDVGTNAEIVLGNRQRLLACSSPTGPAFEGAQITCGQRAATGAIERVRINPETLEPRFQVIGSELWSDEDGFAEAIETLGVTGICGSGIIEVVAEMYLAGIVTVDGIVDGDLASRTPRIIQNDRTWSYVLYSPENDESQILVTQNDIRQIQLAKAALYAGVKLLMDHIGTDKIERIRLAGAFGSHINVQHAMVLGLIPDCVLGEVSSAGNAAGTGARIALLNSQSRHVIETLVKNIEKIETALEPKFQDYFVDAMAFPNKTDPFPNLFSVVTRPEAKTVTDNGVGRKRRRR